MNLRCSMLEGWRGHLCIHIVLYCVLCIKTLHFCVIKLNYLFIKAIYLCSVRGIKSEDLMLLKENLEKEVYIPGN